MQKVKKEYKSKTEAYPSDYQHKESEVEYWAEKNLGSMGRMVGGSKSIYRYDNPDHVVIYNANVFTREDGKIWHGDLDLTEDYKDLQRLSKKIEKKVYVLYEMDGRFENEKKADLSKAVATIEKSEISLKDSEYAYLDKSGAPKQKTDKEIEAELGPVEKSTRQYLKKDFKGAISLPDMDKYKLSVKQSPIDYFCTQLIEMMGSKDKAQDVYLNIQVTEEYDEQVRGLLEKYAKRKFKGMHPVKLEQAIAMSMLDFGPSPFQGNPDWATNKNIGFIRK